jgi:hypothetical protein
MKKEIETEKEARDFEIEVLEAEILGLSGEYREKAMGAYRKLLATSPDKSVYFTRC